VELQDQLEELTNSGIGIAAISYDAPEVLAEFAARSGITYPLLSDNDSAVISKFGILNTVAAEGVGPNRDNPDVVADVAKYVSVFGSNQMIVGTPYPGTFMLDAQSRVSSRFFEEFYRERNTTSNVMLKLGIGLSPIAAIQGSTAQLKFTAYASNPSVTAGTRFSIAVEVEPEPGMHVYAPGAEAMGYRVIGLKLAPSELLRYEPVEFPESETYHFEPLDELVPVYQQPFTILQEVVVNASETSEAAMAEMEALTLSGSLEFQACDDAICYLPVSMPISFTLDLDEPDVQRASRR
jgi:peroxiredoxin